MREGLTEEDYKLLKAPFDVHAVRFRLGSFAGNQKYTVLTYIDSRLVGERLSEVDPNWTAKFFVAEGFAEETTDQSEQRDDWLRHHAPLECHLTVKGTTRVDVGQLPVTAVKPEPDLYPHKKEYQKETLKPVSWEISDKHMKALYSDALKRAAVQFGIGAYLYSLKGFEVDSSEYNDKKFLNAKGTQKMKDRYHTITNHELFVSRFGTVRSYGDEIAAAVDAG